MTDGQIENAVNKLRDAMRKHRSSITSDVAQQVLGVENLGMMMFTPFRERASGLEPHHPQGQSESQSLSARGTRCHRRVQYTDRKVVDSMPKGEGDEVEVVLFKPEPWEYIKSGCISDDDLKKAYERRNSKPADPYSVAAVNEADPTFADEKPQGTRWKDAKGQLVFRRVRPLVRRAQVSVLRLGFDWSDGWWFAGVRK